MAAKRAEAGVRRELVTVQDAGHGLSGGESGGSGRDRPQGNGVCGGNFGWGMTPLPP
jgi:hypothetical protein